MSIFKISVYGSVAILILKEGSCIFERVFSIAESEGDIEESEVPENDIDNDLKVPLLPDLPVADNTDADEPQRPTGELIKSIAP
jgi:hypothetical protein